MKTNILSLLLILASTASLSAQEESEKPTFEQAASQVREDLARSIEQLNAQREQMATEQIPLSQSLNELEAELGSLGIEYQRVNRLLDSRTLDLSNLRVEIQQRKDETTYLANLLGQYVINFDAGLHIAELARYEQALESAQLAPENPNLNDQQVFALQAELLDVSITRLEQALGGVRFEGKAVDGATGLVQDGTFVMVGPAAVFQAANGGTAGLAEQRLGSFEPTKLDFGNPQDEAAAAQLIGQGRGFLPLDPTLGNAHKVEATQESFLEHVQKGGAVMIPIFAMAGIALLVALTKWLSFLFVRKPSRKSIEELFAAVAEHDEQAARERAAALRGPVGQMLVAGVEHMREPRDLVEEVMYESVLTTRLKLDRGLPFIAICAASAPLLGLLGTVTGIINTFKLITVFGSGDVKSLSGGISEALITTKFGLIVAIPSLLLHAFLSRKSRGFVSQMETAAVGFVNQLSKTPFEHTNGGGKAAASGSGDRERDPNWVRRQVAEALEELRLEPLGSSSAAGGAVERGEKVSSTS